MLTVSVTRELSLMQAATCELPFVCLMFEVKSAKMSEAMFKVEPDNSC